MKTIEIIRFELGYHFRRPITYLYFVLLFIISFLFSKLGIKGMTEVSVQVKENAPLVIFQLTALLNLPVILITSAIAGMAVIRDYHTQIAPLLFTTPISQRTYLSGRFLGSLAVMLIISLASVLGSMAGELFSSRPVSELLPFQPATYLQAFAVITLPNVLFLSALYFAGGALSKKTAVVYTQGLLLVILISFLDEGVIETAQNLEIATHFDFYTLQLINLQTKYWSAAEINSQSIPLSGSLIANRLIFIGLGTLALIISFWKFNPLVSTASKTKS